MFEDRFSHYLSYGATDQQTVVRLVDDFDGLLIPGTVAAFQRDGTGGFVLALSATNEPFKYVIDPRFPLFQQALVSPKKSHIDLAELLGDFSLVREVAPSPKDFSSVRIEAISKAWISFNSGYSDLAAAKRAKYEKRLGAPILHEARLPGALLPPYFVANGSGDPWWSLSNEFFETSSRYAPSQLPVIRVLAATDASALKEIVETLTNERVAIWVSGLDEQKSSSGDLAAYIAAIRAAKTHGIETFAIYGGFFSVLLHAVGLGGSSHGVGYGEYRQWLELPQSGPPPQRYYVPQIHRFLQPDDAARLQSADGGLAGCNCVECLNESPANLDYQALMRHSVRCRKMEIEEWSNLDLVQAQERLERESQEWREILESSSLSKVIIDRYIRLAKHLDTWQDAIARALSD